MNQCQYFNWTRTNNDCLFRARIKCFVFVGQVPACEQCHECFFQWYNIIVELGNRISDLRVEISSLVTTYYNDYTLREIQTELDSIQTILNAANFTINTKMLEEADVVSLEASFTQVYTLYTHKYT